MYKCEECSYQSKPGETMFKIYYYVTKLVGFDISGEKKVCKVCSDKDKSKKR